MSDLAKRLAAVKEEIDIQVGHMEGELERVVSEALFEFRRRTGMSPSSITILLSDVTTVGCLTRQRIVSKVMVNMDYEDVIE